MIFPWTMAEAGAVFCAIKRSPLSLRDHREIYRLTTHVPQSSQKWRFEEFSKKHGIDRERINARIAAAQPVT